MSRTTDEICDKRNLSSCSRRPVPLRSHHECLRLAEEKGQVRFIARAFVRYTLEESYSKNFWTCSLRSTRQEPYPSSLSGLIVLLRAFLALRRRRAAILDGKELRSATRSGLNESRSVCSRPFLYYVNANSRQTCRLSTHFGSLASRVESASVQRESCPRDYWTAASVGAALCVW